VYIDNITANAQLFLLILARVIAVIQIAPLISSGAIPQLAKIGIGFFAAVAVFPWVQTMGYPIPESGLAYAGVLLGEVLVGIIIGFILQIIYAAFLVAGQFFSLQMGFGASQTFDPLAQVQIPIMGQFLNIIAMFVFISVGGFQRIFLIGVFRSFESVQAVDFMLQREYLFRLFLKSLGELFEHSLVISFPILGTLFLVSLSMGLLAKAAPQMNLLMMGFPVAIGVAFLILFFTLPFLMEAFGRIIDLSFFKLAEIFERAGGGP
jgi:flagellar biosynthetic protein FliR